MKRHFINRNFFLIWSGKLVSMIGDRFYTIVLALWVLKKSNSPAIMGVVLVASALPAFLVGFLSGAIVDLANRKRIMIITDLIRGLLISLVAYLEFAGVLELRHIVAVSIAVSMLNAFFDPAVKALIPDVVEAKDLPGANALEQLINGLSGVTAPILGAVAIGAVGYFGGFLINGISFILSAFFELFIDAPKNIRKPQTETRSLADDIKGGFSFVFQNGALMKVVAIIAVVHFAVGSFSLVLPFLAQSISENEMNLGLLQGFIGIGMVIGATKLNVKNLRRRNNSLLILLVCILGALYLLSGALRSLHVATIIPYLVIVALMGMTISNAASFWQLLLQLNTPPDKRGRVFGIVSILSNISMPIAYGTIGILLETIDFPVYLMLLGALFLLISLAWRRKLG
jgi:DHA3 family macrolide efflux protein-like MFS transporter